MESTCSASALILIMSISATSVPMDISAASLTAASIVSSSKISDKSVSRKLVRNPHLRTSLEYCALSPAIACNSGKCHPYHSFTRMAYVLISLSSSSKSPTACTTMVSTLSAENLSLYLERECERPNCIARMSDPVIPPPSASDFSSNKLSKCCRIPRKSSCVLESFTTLQDILETSSLMLTAIALSATAKDPFSFLSCFFKKVFRDLHTLPSILAAAADTASAVSAKG
mmetsp:Transcript_19110/g.26492  ORF Transcript_19110/g.26492 Transcript_19110/m.26492 type:complete len:229 (-) Transcript_19110:291-977(-)